MRAVAEVTVIIALVACVAAFTLVSVVAAFEAAVTVRFTTYGTDDTLLADDWTMCDGFDAVTCD